MQALLEDALARFEGAPVTVHGAGRTDAGVHALGQVASAQVTFSHDVSTLARALNAQLPDDVRVVAVDRGASRLSRPLRRAVEDLPLSDSQRCDGQPLRARRSSGTCRSRSTSRRCSGAAASLIGRHDFEAFRSVGTEVPDSIRTLTVSTVARAPAEGAVAR